MKELRWRLILTRIIDGEGVQQPLQQHLLNITWNVALNPIGTLQTPFQQNSQRNWDTHEKKPMPFMSYYLQQGNIMSS